jgi:hypothetical protein
MDLLEPQEQLEQLVLLVLMEQLVLLVLSVLLVLLGHLEQFNRFLIMSMFQMYLGATLQDRDKSEILTRQSPTPLHNFQQHKRFPSSSIWRVGHTPKM